MTAQLPLPGYWPLNTSRPDAADQLHQLRQDKLEAKVEIRSVLDRFAGKYGVHPKAVNGMMYGYVDDILEDLFFDKESELQEEIDAEIDRER